MRFLEGTHVDKWNEYSEEAEYMNDQHYSLDWR